MYPLPLGLMKVNTPYSWSCLYQPRLTSVNANEILCNLFTLEFADVQRRPQRFAFIYPCLIATMYWLFWAKCQWTMFWLYTIGNSTVLSTISKSVDLQVEGGQVSRILECEQKSRWRKKWSSFFFPTLSNKHTTVSNGKAEIILF